MRAANYVEETTTSIAGTSGDGAVTLTQITNVPRFSTVFGTQATHCRYVIEDTVNKKFETGFGSVSSNVLTRTFPSITWDGTTYDDTAPSALQFGSSPTSGNIKIRMSPTAETQGVTFGHIQTSVTSGADSWKDYPLSGHLIRSSDTGSAVFNMASDKEIFQYYRLDRSGRLTGVQVEVTTGAASFAFKWALFAVRPDTGLPGNKITDFNTQTPNTTTGIITDTTTGTWSPAGPIYLTPGWYAIGFLVSTGGNPNFRGYLNTAQRNIASQTPLGSTSGYLSYRSCISGITSTYSSGFNSPPNFTGGAFNSPIWVGLRIEA